MKKLLEIPKVYDWFQQVAGGTRAREHFIREHVRPQPGQRVLDIGCGTGAMRSFFPDVDYHGYDPSEAYIEQANREQPGQYTCKILTTENFLEAGQFDVVHSTGVLHHLPDDQVLGLLSVGAKALKPGAKMFTLDGCHLASESWLEKTFLNMDRGKFVRPREDFEALARTVFSDVTVYEYPRLFRPMPYPVLIMEMQNGN
ncbi:class I SAM-dependent methyltransferase [Cerasicoccus frondis]|uniref:class I SAM-dependent methyltransferase n=1 Tax=Cerasicoccus frondis TaxID=490090 RepID=UPI002852B809|nr:class I SAM-dependent methyltransferase [Cerasicoccus frondis]